MATRKSRNTDSTSKLSESTSELRQALTQRKKVELVEFLLVLAEEDLRILRKLTIRFKMTASVERLEAATRQAIVDATAFDKRDMNRNFNYDREAYAEAKRLLELLVAAEQCAVVMQLSLELMKLGSHQVEMSDEGLMTDDIEECLNVVIQALKKSSLSSAEVIAWCSAMLENDCVRFIAEKPLKSLLNQFQQ
ncbi:hypothetical protein KIH39_08720 [Telmatocola sphagniphila]|uniref:Uncharacterized protein n=1 Tax=Telmatocola sphagniphila TaxID=1123043 RepID=A0A8E6B8R7_9BACT|nr:hypothetical protein [Telmatocola sphagniphila]QVL33973.1 hypothetical protein KIH39_08720 [Telmatocola sphagniphila]